MGSPAIPDTNAERFAMKPFVRRLLGLMPIIGGGAGLTTILLSMASEKIGVSLVIVYFLFGALYVAGIVAGLWILEEHRHGVALSLVWWALQIPQLLSLPLNVYFWTPLNLGLWWNFTQSKLGISSQIGSGFMLQMPGRTDFVVAVNLLAVACSLYLYLLYRRQYPARHEAAPTAIALAENPLDP